jgi:hypothetical protein
MLTKSRASHNGTWAQDNHLNQRFSETNQHLTADALGPELRLEDSGDWISVVGGSHANFLTGPKMVVPVKKKTKDKTKRTSKISTVLDSGDAFRASLSPVNSMTTLVEPIPKEPSAKVRKRKTMNEPPVDNEGTESPSQKKKTRTKKRRLGQAVLHQSRDDSDRMIFESASEQITQKHHQKSVSSTTSTSRCDFGDSAYGELEEFEDLSANSGARGSVASQKIIGANDVLGDVLGFGQEESDYFDGDDNNNVSASQPASGQQVDGADETNESQSELVEMKSIPLTDDDWGTASAADNFCFCCEYKSNPLVGESCHYGRLEALLKNDADRSELAVAILVQRQFNDELRSVNRLPQWTLLGIRKHMRECGANLETARLGYMGRDFTRMFHGVKDKGVRYYNPKTRRVVYDATGIQLCSRILKDLLLIRKART